MATKAKITPQFHGKPDTKKSIPWGWLLHHVDDFVTTDVEADLVRVSGDDLSSKK